MNNNSGFVPSIISIVIVTIVVTLVAVPVISDFQEEPVILQFDNDLDGNKYHATVVEDDLADLELAASFTANDNFITINGAQFTKKSDSNIAIASDKFVIILVWSGDSNTLVVHDGDAKYPVPAATDLTLSKSGTTITVVFTPYGTELTKTYDVSWLAFLDDEGDYNNLSSPNTATFYVKSLDDVIVSAYVSTDWTVAFGGEATVGGDPAEIAGTLDAVDGTDGQVFTVSDYKLVADGSDVKPAMCLIPASVTCVNPAHAMQSSLLGVVSLMLILVPVMMAAALIRGKTC